MLAVQQVSLSFELENQYEAVFAIQPVRAGSVLWYHAILCVVFLHHQRKQKLMRKRLILLLLES